MKTSSVACHVKFEKRALCAHLDTKFIALNARIASVLFTKKKYQYNFNNSIYSLLNKRTTLLNMDKVMVPGFILKLWKMINDPQCDDLISWSENGQSFIIINPPRFSQELSKYFKHNNLSSFIRQLNMYGFRKVATIENSGLHPGTEDLHFYHPDFVKNNPERLEAIKRKLPQKVVESVDLRNVIKDISEIEDKQKDVTKTLAEIKRENDQLWAELQDLRQKHKQQQLYISRLMTLVFEAMEKNGIKTNMLALKSNTPLMIEASEEVQSEVPVQTTVDQLQANYEGTNPNPSYQHIEENINNNGDQIDSLVPTIMDFDEENVIDWSVFN